MADNNSQEQRRKTQQIEAIGRLTTGAAQDLNNLLAMILSCTERELARLPADDRAAASFKEIDSATRRAVARAHQLLDFSRSQIYDPKAINLNDPIIKMERMLGRLLSDEIELVTVPGAGLDLVEVDAGQIEQVILGLAVNAGDAMPDGGKLTIRTTNITLDEDYVSEHPDASTGPHCVISFHDTGQGMTASVMDRIFEPFFTTKGEGKGSGLGLATCNGIVMQMGGHIEVSSEVGQGSTVQVYLPSVGSTKLAPAREDEFGDAPSGHETMLLVEDEPLVRKLASRTLRDLGYTVLEASNGVEAESLANECSETIDLLLADVVMPQMGGAELARHLGGNDHEIPALLMSGYIDSDSDVAGQLRSGASFLQKPFKRGDLARKVREVLDGSNPSREGEPAVPAGR